MSKLYPSPLLVAVSLHFIIFSILGISRHLGYMTSINDLGCFDQVLWNIIHNNFPLNTSVFSQPINWFSFHFHPILYFFVPFYYLIPTVNWFIFTQSAALSVAALPIFLLAKQVTNSEKQALLWGLIYLFNPFVLSADAWDFHPVCLAVPFIALSFLAVEQQKPWLFASANIVLLLCQEQFGLTVACFGLLYGLKNKEMYVSSLFLMLGVVSVIFILTIAMPSLSPTNQHLMFGNHSGNNAHLSRYTWLGHSLKEVISTLVFSPVYVFQRVLFEFHGLFYLRSLLLPVLFTALAAPLFMLPMTPDLLANILAANPLPRSICSYHSVAIIPVLTTAAIYGCQKIYRYCSLLPPKKLTSCICGVTIIWGYLFAPLPLPFAENIWHPVQLIAKYDPREDEIKALIENHSISAQANIGPHFSQREKIYLFPSKIAESDYVILWLSSPSKYNYFLSNYNSNVLAQDIQMLPIDYLDKIENLLSSKNFKIAYWNDPWLVFKKEPKLKTDEREPQVLNKIKTARKNLQTLNPM